MSSLNQYVMGMDLRLDLLGRQTNVQLLSAAGGLVSIPWTDLLASATDPVTYGSHLSTALFGDAAVHTALTVARTQADSAGLPLHVGIDLSGCPPEIHALRWETLQDPEPEQVGWALSERLLLSRRLASSDMLPVEPRASPVRSALVAVAAPSDLDQYGFSPIPIAAELDRAHAALSPLRLTTLARGHGDPCTLQHLLTSLRGGSDILCLVAHGRSVGGEVHLWLEDELGQSAPIASRELAAHLTALDPAARPVLIILAICESGGVDATGMPLSAIGPMLASHGFAAVLAMHGRLSLETNAAFLPAVLREALRDGVIDRAVAAARGGVFKRSDWWTPILWLRLPHGRLWAPTSGVLPGKPGTFGGDGIMDSARGIAALKDCITRKSPSDLAAVTTLEASLEQNQRSEQLFGTTEMSRSERARIFYSLNEIALRWCGVSFNDFCRGASLS